jgi:hypothetical protein
MKNYAGLMKLKRKVLFLSQRQIFDLTFSIFITKLSTFLDVFLFNFPQKLSSGKCTKVKFKCVIPCSYVSLSLLYLVTHGYTVSARLASTVTTVGRIVTKLANRKNKNDKHMKKTRQN